MENCTIVYLPTLCYPWLRGATDSVKAPPHSLCIYGAPPSELSSRRFNKRTMVEQREQLFHFCEDFLCLVIFENECTFTLRNNEFKVKKVSMTFHFHCTFSTVPVSQYV